MGPGKELFGHACASGGVILRPGSNHKVMCAHARDHGAYCGSFCPSPGGKLCSDAWRPEDIGEYLRLQTLSYRSSPEYGYYNEFLIHGLVWDRNLPHSIEGFLTSKGDGMVSSRAHADFLKKYGVSAEDYPLLTMTRSLTKLFVVGKKFAEKGDPTGVERGPGWLDRPPYSFERTW